MAQKVRLDQQLLQRGLADSRSRAQALIRTGMVTVDGQVFDKPGMSVAAESAIEVRASMPYVGRGGLKLAAALDAFGLDPTGQVCLDVGASTGGFTDVLLQRGAARVFAVDVGRAQLAWKLRQDPRVTSLERTDVRQLSGLPDMPTLAVVDVSFISLKLVLPATRRLIAPAAPVIALVKPQFEAGRASVARGGVVRDPAVHAAVLTDIADWASAAGWRIVATVPSPITGADGNREWFIWLVGDDEA
jgi:23S rRNA (cytidine1920-2'-O)/16S rRNA (cytidine1409-2'-O)-methyltransferase